MADRVSPEVRSKIMSAIKGKGTKLETEVMKALWKKGLRFQRNVDKMYRKPDLVLKKWKTVIFIDSCYWHGCPEHFRMPTSNVEYWEKKISRNQERDREADEWYPENGWNLVRAWEHDFKQDFDGTIQEIVDFVNEIKEKMRKEGVK